MKVIRNFVYTLHNSINGFEKGQLPEGSLVKIKTESSSKNGKKYGNKYFLQKFEIEKLDEKLFIKDFINYLTFMLIVQISL